MDNEKRIKDLEKTIAENKKEINKLNKQVETLKQPANVFNDQTVEKIVVGSIIGMLLFNIFRD